MAQIVINIPNSQVSRIQEAFAWRYGLGSPATGSVTLQLVKDKIVADLKEYVKLAEEERSVAIAVAAAIQGIGSPQEITLT